MQSLRFEGMEPHLPGKYPVVILRDIVVFPHLICQLFVERETSVRAVERALETDRFLFLTAQRDLNIEYPMPKDMYTVGTICLLLRMIRVKEGNNMKVLIQGLFKASRGMMIQTEPFFVAAVEKIEERKPKGDGLEGKLLLSEVKKKLDRAIAYGKSFPADILLTIENMSDPDKLSNVIAANIELAVEEAQKLLEMTDPMQRLEHVSDILSRKIIGQTG